MQKLSGSTQTCEYKGDVMGLKLVDNLTENKNTSGLNSDQILTMVRTSITRGLFTNIRLARGHKKD